MGGTERGWTGAVDVSSEIVIARPRGTVAAFAAEYVPNERIVMRTAEGPFPLETTYAWSSTERDGTRMVLRNRGHPGGFAGLIAPIVAASMRCANRAELVRLKAVLERPNLVGRGRSTAGAEAAPLAPQHRRA